MAGKRGRRSYLDDFQRDVNGEYQYRGAHYRYAGTMEYRTLRRSLWLCCGFGTALVLAAGCLPGATAGAAWYVTLPTMLALVAAGVLDDRAVEPGRNDASRLRSCKNGQAPPGGGADRGGNVCLRRCGAGDLAFVGKSRELGENRSFCCARGCIRIFYTDVCACETDGL